MKNKILSLLTVIILAVMLVTLAGCGDKGSEKKNDEKGQESEKIEEAKGEKLASVVKVGDYVAYIPNGKISTESKYAINHSKDQVITENWSKWRVLQVEDGKVTLVGTPFGLYSNAVRVLSEDTIEGSITDYENGTISLESVLEQANEPNRICEELYSSNIGKARSISIEDINTLLQVDLNDSKVKPYNENYKPGETVEFQGHEFSTLYGYTLSDFTKEGSLEYELLGLSSITSYFIGGSLGFAHDHNEFTDPLEPPGVGTMDYYYIDYWVNNKGVIKYQNYGNVRLMPVVELNEDVVLLANNTGDGSTYENAWKIYDEIEDVKINNEEDAYKNVINHRSYYDQMETWGMDIDHDYALCDLNKDGIKELIIRGYYSDTAMGFYNTVVYTYNKDTKEVECVENFYSYGGIRFNEETGEIAYAELRPFKDAGGYGFYKFDGKEFVIEKEAGYSYSDYQVVDKDGNKKSITMDEYSSYFEGFEYLEYQDIERE